MSSPPVERPAGAGVRLTRLASGGGCASKLPAADLAGLLRGLPAVTDASVLVGSATFDDAAVVRLRDDLAVVQSVDFFAPPVDDPYDYGRIAAANALSDVYAMGGTPRFALAILAVPRDLDGAVAAAILRGGAAVAAAAGAPVVGGHSVVDPEPKYGLVVTGTVDPGRVWSNAGGRPGDVLLLTKPLGTGVVANALRADAAPAAVLAAAVAGMVTTNRDAADRLRAAGDPHACTDVTGFGLVGHLHELALASGLQARVEARALPLLPGVRALVEAGLVPGGSRRNRATADDYARFEPTVPHWLAALACDAQTSGGLLAAVPPERAAQAPGVVVGRLEAGPAGRVLVE